MIQQKQTSLSLVWTCLLMACCVVLFMFGGRVMQFMNKQVTLNMPELDSVDSRDLLTSAQHETLLSNVQVEEIEVLGGPPPTQRPTARPNGPTVAPSIAPAKDYSCVHSTAWLYNSKGVYSANYGSTVDITTTGWTNATLSTTGWKVTYTGIPYYDHVIEQSEINLLNARPKAATDFVTGQTTAVAGDFYNFGDNIGFTTNKCVDGFWPPGPGCPIAYTGTSTFPVYPSPEYKSGGCYIPYHIGLFVNGVPFWSWSDATSYDDEDVWNCLAMEFEQYDMDICSGHSGSNVYHHHSLSPCLMTQLNDTGAGHSPVHGFALDGYPIYGPYQGKNQLAVSCWQARDYSSSATGCAGGQRTCQLINSYNYKLGTTTASQAGPPLNSTVETQSKNWISSNSGIYYEDMFYNLTCTQQGLPNLDSYNGHTHGTYGYHYHLTMDSTGTPTFPYTMGPKFYGCQTSGSCQTGISSGTGTSVCTNTYTQKSGACTAFVDTTGIPYPTANPTNAPNTRKPSFRPTTSVPSRSQAPTRGPTAGPSVKPTEKPTDSPLNPTEKPTADPTFIPTELPSFDPTHTPTHVPTFDPTFHPSVLPSHNPSIEPSVDPTIVPTVVPSVVPTDAPTHGPTFSPTYLPSVLPTAAPTETPTESPTAAPTPVPSVVLLTRKPTTGGTPLTNKPTITPSLSKPSVSAKPTVAKTGKPISSSEDEAEPTVSPTKKKTKYPSAMPIKKTHKPTQAKKTHKPTRIKAKFPGTNNNN